MYGEMQHMMGGGGLWWLWMVVPLLFWVVVIGLVVWAVVNFFPTGRGEDRSGAPRNSAEEILRERFARGEIDAEEYERAQEVLRSEPAGGLYGDVAPNGGERRISR